MSDRQAIYDTREHHNSSQGPTVSQAVNFNQQSAYFWINPTIDLEGRLFTQKQTLTQSSELKKKKLKSKQTYFSS